MAPRNSCLRASRYSTSSPPVRGRGFCSIAWTQQEEDEEEDRGRTGGGVRGRQNEVEGRRTGEVQEEEEKEDSRRRRQRGGVVSGKHWCVVCICVCEYVSTCVYVRACLTGNRGVGCWMDGGSPSARVMPTTSALLKGIDLRPRPRPRAAITAAANHRAVRARERKRERERAGGTRRWWSDLQHRRRRRKVSSLQTVNGSVSCFNRK